MSTTTHKSGKKKCLIRSTRNKKNGVYERQRVRTTRNKLNRLKKHVERFPNDGQAQRKLKELNNSY